jgi:Concanavalin A-like lectin/glucanases superfamily
VRNVAASQIDGSRDGAVVGCLWSPGRWPEKFALEFKRTSDRVRINVPGEFDRLSLAAWVRMEGLNFWLSALMLTDGWDLGEVHWQITADGELLLGVSLPDTHDGDGHRSPPVLGPQDLGRWVHLATVYDKQTNLITHYLDGKRVSQGYLRVPTTMRIGPANLGNWNPYPDFLRNSRRSLNGRIDEFAILRRALTDDEVRQMYEMGKPNS